MYCNFRGNTGLEGQIGRNSGGGEVPSDRGRQRFYFTETAAVVVYRVVGRRPDIISTSSAVVH